MRGYHLPIFRLSVDPKGVSECAGLVREEVATARSMNRLMLTIVVSEKRSLRSLKAQNYSKRKALFAGRRASICDPGLQ